MKTTNTLLMETTIQATNCIDKVSKVITSEEPNYLKLAFIYDIVKSYENGEDLPELPQMSKSIYSQAKDVIDL